MSGPRVRSYEVTCTAFPGWPPARVNAASAGQAKRGHHRTIRESWPEVPYTAMRARVAGPPHSDEHFLHVARLRGRPGVRCGDRVRLDRPDGREGTIVGCTTGANWEVLFDDGGGGAVHPDSCDYLPRGGAAAVPAAVKR